MQRPLPLVLSQVDMENDLLCKFLQLLLDIFEDCFYASPLVFLSQKSHVKDKEN